ncbi:MAG: Fe-S-containing protein [Bacillota bacterium]
MSSTKQKREEFLSGNTKYKGPNRVVILVFAIIAAVGVGWFYYVSAKNTPVVTQRWEGGNYNIGKSVSYKNEKISMTDIQSAEAAGKISFSLDAVIKGKILFIETNYKHGSGANKALMAVITPAGRLIVGMAMCEPCRSQRFHIEENNLVCDTCGTRWFLNDLRGLSGGCPQYPPEMLPYEVKDGTVFIPADIVREWDLRI